MDLVIPKDIFIRFLTELNRMLSQNFDPVTLEKNVRWRGPRCPPVFPSLKKDIRTFNLRWNEPSCDILGQLGRYNHP